MGIFFLINLFFFLAVMGFHSSWPWEPLVGNQLYCQYPWKTEEKVIKANLALTQQLSSVFLNIALSWCWLHFPALFTSQQVRGSLSDPSNPTSLTYSLSPWCFSHRRSCYLSSARMFWPVYYSSQLLGCYSTGRDTSTLSHADSKPSQTVDEWNFLFHTQSLHEHVAPHRMSADDPSTHSPPDETE